jgi:hypothetical protein
MQDDPLKHVQWITTPEQQCADCLALANEASRRFDELRASLSTQITSFLLLNDDGIPQVAHLPDQVLINLHLALNLLRNYDALAWHPAEAQQAVEAELKRRGLPY